jgi:zinc transport system substrate-binding protein
LGVFLALPSPRQPWAEEKLRVTVSIVPQKYFVQKIGGRFVDVSVMVLPGASPAIYEPKPKQMAALARSRIYFAIGVPFERIWLPKFAAVSPDMAIVRTEEGIKRIPMKGRHGRDEGVRHKENRHHEGIRDPHIWLSPPLVKIQAGNILRALVKLAPDHRTFFESNYRVFLQEVDRLHKELRTLFSEKGRRKAFMVYHPAWGYFAGAYELNQIPVEMEGKEPKPRALQALIQHAKREGVKVIFVQPQFSTKSAQAMAKAIGGQVVFADPLALEWDRNLRRVAEAFGAALR